MGTDQPTSTGYGAEAGMCYKVRSFYVWQFKFHRYAILFFLALLRLSSLLTTHIRSIKKGHAYGTYEGPLVGLTAGGVLVEVNLHVTPARLRGVAGARCGAGTNAVPVVVGVGVALREVTSGTPAPGVADDETMSRQELHSHSNVSRLWAPATVVRGIILLTYLH